MLQSQTHSETQSQTPYSSWSVKSTDLKEKHQIALPQNHSSNGQVPCQDH